MEKYITELLNNNVRVVLPDLGAFIVKQRKPLKIIFNEFLKYNDGLLIEYIAKSEDLSKDDSTKKVTEYVDGIKEKLNKNENITVEGLGILSKDSAGNIVFELAKDTSVKTDSEALKTEKKEKVKEPEVKEEKKETTAKSKTTIAAKKEEPKKEEPKVSPVNIPTAAQNVSQDKKSVSTSEPAYRSSRYTKQTSDDEKKRAWLWLVAAAIAILIVFLILNINKAPKKSKKTIAVETQTPAVEESTSSEESETTPVETNEIKPITTAAGKRYYIIAGCFRVPSNADNYVIFLRKKGYPAEKLGIFNGYHVVSFNSFPTRKEALQELEVIRKDYEAEAWLKKR